MTEQPMTTTTVSGTPRQAKVDGHWIMGDSQGRGGGREREREGDELKSRERVVLSEDDMTDM